MSFRSINWPYPKGRNPSTLRRMRERIEELSEGFQHYLDFFSKNNPFSGPSIYFHTKTLNLRKSSSSLQRLLDDDDYIDSIYATLTSWGLHRMGPKGAKLSEREMFKSSLQETLPVLFGLEEKWILEIPRNEAEEVAGKVSHLFEKLKLSATGTRARVDQGL